MPADSLTYGFHPLKPTIWRGMRSNRAINQSRRERRRELAGCRGQRVQDSTPTDFHCKRWHLSGMQ